VHWYEIDLATGAVRRGSETMAEAVSVYRGGFVATCRESLGLCLYSDFDSLDAQTPSERFEEFICQTRFGVRGDEISCAWHSTDVVEVYDLRTGDHVRSIPLEDYDTWVWGVSVAGGRLHLIDDGRGEHEVPGQRIVSFDPLTGARLGEVHLTGLFPDRYTHWPGGLWCESPGPELP
jgi:nitrite reductase/ring-hydroxylating ferredoxin subunit